MGRSNCPLFGESRPQVTQHTCDRYLARFPTKTLTNRKPSIISVQFPRHCSEIIEGHRLVKNPRSRCLEDASSKSDPRTDSAAATRAELFKNNKNNKTQLTI